ncbi:MAG TPA: DUF4293 domain-containing protein [Chitinophagaceae bacterium]|jgi:hypothetical protein|nr:DUF4293 domain-containing protein [Chitinophagaceae bacterium]
MIQRLQSIWLVLAAICGFALTQVPLFIGRLANNMVKKIIATESLLLFAISVGVACLAAACIFLYKNRPLQFKLSVIGVVLSILVVCLEVWYVEQFKDSNQMVRGTYYWGGLLPIAMTVFFILAARGIYKDERLVKSLDRLR